MLVGTTVDPHAYDRLTTYPGSRMCRVFGYSGKGGPPSWRPTTGDARISRLLAAGIMPAAVWQDWPNDQRAHELVTAWLDEVDQSARLTWRHEADRKETDHTRYRIRYFRLAEWVDAHPNGHYVTLVPTQTYQWTMSKGRGDYALWYTGIGIAGVDVYADSWRTDYPIPQVFLSPLWRYRDTINQPIELPEFGAARLPGDPTGERRAAFLYECAQLMRAEGVTAVCYWDDIGSNGTDLRLWRDRADTPEAETWRQVIAENNAGDLGAEPPTEPNQ